ncbi:phospholipid scramblase 1 [Ceratobasidium sp. 370]|nr:phospholipid scramblase 1 [Ceratobasidium sp. 370]
MPSKTLTAVWAGLDFILLLAGGISIAFSIIWRAPDLLRDLVISTTDLNAGLGLGIMFAITFVISIAAILTPKATTGGLKALNWTLIADSAATIIIGSIVWFFTLQERKNFSEVWGQQSTETLGRIQERFQCCGYYNGTDRAIGTGVCASQTFALNSTGCVGPVTDFADYTLNNIFTSVYGFQAIIIALFLATTCIINKRVEEERFRKIDAKRGGRGFV